MNMHTHMSNISILLTHPLTLSCFIPFPIHLSTLPFYLLGDPLSCARGANIHPPLSLVSYQLFFPVCLTHPEDTPQIKLHIYSRRGIYNQRENYNQWPFCGLFSYVKIFFSTFFFLHLKLRTICYKKQEKKSSKKCCFRGEKLS